MNTIDKLVPSVPQSVHNEAALVGLSAWHLYPDLMMYEDGFKEIIQADPLICHEGILTIRLESSRVGYWSALATSAGKPALLRRPCYSD
jgi:hypothetical protein